MASAVAQSIDSHDKAPLLAGGAYKLGLARVASPGDRLSNAKIQQWFNNAWRDSLQTRYTAHDAAGNELERYAEKWTSGSWVAYQRRTKAYTSANNVYADTIFSGVTGSPVIATANSFTADGKPDVILRKIRLGGNWTEVYRDTYTYNASGFPESLLEENKIGGWVNYGRYLFGTDASGTLVAEEYQSFNGQTGNWDPVDFREYTYNSADSIVMVVGSLWNTATGAYEVEGRSIQRFNAQGLLDSIYNYKIDAATGDFPLNGIATYKYDARGNRIEQLDQIGSSLGALVNKERRLYSYTLTGLQEDVLAAASVTVAPNPASGSATLQYELTKATSVGVTLHDVLGRAVGAPVARTVQAAGLHTFSLDLTGVAPGVYVARVVAGTSVRQHKLVVR